MSTDPKEEAREILVNRIRGEVGEYLWHKDKTHYSDTDRAMVDLANRTLKFLGSKDRFAK